MHRGINVIPKSRLLQVTSKQRGVIMILQYNTQPDGPYVYCYNSEMHTPKVS